MLPVSIYDSEGQVILNIVQSILCKMKGTWESDKFNTLFKAQGGYLGLLHGLSYSACRCSTCTLQGASRGEDEME